MNGQGQAADREGHGGGQAQRDGADHLRPLDNKKLLRLGIRSERSAKGARPIIGESGDRSGRALHQQRLAGPDDRRSPAGGRTPTLPGNR